MEFAKNARHQQLEYGMMDRVSSQDIKLEALLIRTEMGFSLIRLNNHLQTLTISVELIVWKPIVEG